MFGVSVVGHDYVNNLVNTSSLVEGPIHIVNWDQLEQLVGQKLGLGDDILVNEVSGGSSINHGFGGRFFHGVKWIGSMMDFGPSSREWMMSFRFIRFSHLGRHGLRGLVGGSVDVSGSCASS